MPRPTNAALLRNLKRAHIMLRDISVRHDIDVKSLSNCEYRFEHIVKARREFCILAHATGIGSVTIARVLRCTPGSVRYHIRPNLRAHKRNYYRAQRDEARAAT